MVVSLIVCLFLCLFVCLFVRVCSEREREGVCVGRGNDNDLWCLFFVRVPFFQLFLKGKPKHDTNYFI